MSSEPVTRGVGEYCGYNGRRWFGQPRRPLRDTKFGRATLSGLYDDFDIVA